MRRPPLAAALAAAAALALGAASAATAAPAAAGSTVTLNWVEKVSNKGTTMTLRFVDLTTGSGTWSVRVEIANTGTSAVRIARTQFGLAEFDTKTNFTQPTGVLRASSLIPAPPASLAPGAVWKGLIGGKGTPDERQFVRVVLGPFSSAASPQAFTWISDHARHVFAIKI